MDFKRTEEQELLLESAREIFERYGSEEYINRCEEAGERPIELLRALHENGFDMLGAPEELGGTPCDILTLAMYTEEASHVCVGGYMAQTSALTVDDMATFGNEEQLAACIESINNLKVPFCLGLSEPESGSDTRAITTTYRRENGKVVINGRKHFITFANIADNMLCLAKNADESDPEKIFTTWLVPMNSPGITLKEIPKIGWHMRCCCEVTLDNVVIEETDMLGKEGNGFINTMKNFEVERLMQAATACGQARYAFDKAVAYANQRVQFGKTIGSFQLIQEKIMNMRIKIVNMQHLVYRAAWKKDQGMSINTDSAMAKYYCAKASSEVINEAIQIFGGLGYSSELPLGRLWLNNRIYSIGGGTSEVLIHVGGRATLKEFAAQPGSFMP